MKKIIVLLVLSFICVSSLTAQNTTKVWPHPYLKPLAWEDTGEQVKDNVVSIRLTPGEYEPATFAVRNESKSISVSVKLSNKSAGNLLPESWVSIRKVVSRIESKPPDRLMEFSGKQTIDASRTQYFWVTVKAPGTAGSGTYDNEIVVSDGTSEYKLELKVNVLPFKLEQSDIKGGAFMASLSLPSSWYKDMVEHGLNSIQAFWGGWRIGILKDGNNIRCDFSDFDKIMNNAIEGGLNGPFVVSLGNDHHMHYERRIAEAMGWAVDTSEVIDGKPIISPEVTPELDRLFIDGLKQINDHWDSSFPDYELVILIYDEPTERLLDRGKQRYEMLKTVMPDKRVYGVVMNRSGWAFSMVDQMDVIVSNGDFVACQEVAERFDKDYWIYGFPMQYTQTARHDMGILAWRTAAKGVFFWMYNYWGYNPDGCAVYPLKDDMSQFRSWRHIRDDQKFIPSIAWEAIREGQDDLDYVKTAEIYTLAAPQDIKLKAARKLEDIRKSIVPDRRQKLLTGEEHDELTKLDFYGFPSQIRDQIVDLILWIQDNQ